MSAPAIEVPEAVGVEEVTTYVPPEEARKKATSKKRWAGASVIVAALSVAFFITAVLFVDMPVIAAGTFLACLFPALILSLHLLLEGLPLGLDDLLDAVAATGGESDASCGPDLISHHWMRMPGVRSARGDQRGRPRRGVARRWVMGAMAVFWMAVTLFCIAWLVYVAAAQPSKLDNPGVGAVFVFLGAVFSLFHVAAAIAGKGIVDVAKNQAKPPTAAVELVGAVAPIATEPAPDSD